ncbi:MAG: large conductance mechanosensitive channel protein MscL [Clostridiales bacterium]|nr:large conductance mechanosensitive channel protein MscL [Clostridiales bacterium]
MKKFFAEFKEFISKGNVMDLAVGVIIGGAFSSIVTSLTDNIIQPLINCIGGADIQGKIKLFNTENYIDYGAFISAIINFIIMAFVIFCMVKAINKLMNIAKHPKEVAPTTKVCPYCKSEIPIDAVKCCHCTSDLTETPELPEE